MWAKIMKERFGAKNPRSLLLRTHCQTAGVSLTAQQPVNNVVRVAIQALAGVLGGTQSLHTNSMDETLALPTEESVTVALRTQQIIAEESGVTNFVHPLGGSWAIEALTDRMEKDAFAYIDRIDELGGIIRAINIGFPQKEIADAAYRYQQQLDAKEKEIVGVNSHVVEEERPLEILKIDPEVERSQIALVKQVKQERDRAAAEEQLGRVHAAARNGQNLMPVLIDAVKAHCTVGEISDVYREVFGVYQDPAWL